MYYVIPSLVKCGETIQSWAKMHCDVQNCQASNVSKICSINLVCCYVLQCNFVVIIMFMTVNVNEFWQIVCRTLIFFREKYHDVVTVSRCCIFRCKKHTSEKFYQIIYNLDHGFIVLIVHTELAFGSVTTPFTWLCYNPCFFQTLQLAPLRTFALHIINMTNKKYEPLCHRINQIINE